MADSAYTPKELRPHTDSTYSLDAPGLQILLCMEYDATGGESILVDGFRVAQQLQQDDPMLYAALGQIEVIGIYKGDGSNLQARRPILRHDTNGRLIQVTFNNYDRATIRLAEPQMTQLYSGIRYLDTRFNSSTFQWRHHSNKAKCPFLTIGGFYMVVVPSGTKWLVPISIGKIF